MQTESSNHEIILVYHNFRGMAQLLRYMLYYLGIAFKEVLLNPGETVLSKNFKLKNKINEEPELPCLIIGDEIIQDCFTAIHYICQKNNRNDLFGKTLEERAIIREIQYNYLIRKTKAIKIFFKFGEQAAHYPDKKQLIRKQAMHQWFKTSGCAIQCIELKTRSPNSRYLLGHISILDFMFYQECFYCLNLFGNLEQKNCGLLDTLNSIFGTDWQNTKERTSIYLKVMRQFKETFETEQFYVKNKQKLESYSVICKVMGENFRNAFKGVWIGSNSFLN